MSKPNTPGPRRLRSHAESHPGPPRSTSPEMQQHCGAALLLEGTCWFLQMPRSVRLRCNHASWEAIPSIVGRAQSKALILSMSPYSTCSGCCKLHCKFSACCLQDVVANPAQCCRMCARPTMQTSRFGSASWTGHSPLQKWIPRSGQRWHKSDLFMIFTPPLYKPQSLIARLDNRNMAISFLAALGRCRAA